jgi:N-terminal acetyltransferase B complex catalytic subunit
MYEGMGYSVYRRVREYYGNLGLGKGGRDEEDAFGMFLVNFLVLHAHESMADMRKPLKRDPQRKSVRPGGREQVIHANEAP